MTADQFYSSVIVICDVTICGPKGMCFMPPNSICNVWVPGGNSSVASV